MRPGCRRFQRQLSPYLDGELPPEAAAKMEQHLAGCAACHERLEGQRFAARLVANLPLPATTTVPVCPSWALPPADDAQPPARPRKLVLQLAAATALLTIIATGVWFFLRPRGASWEVARLSGTPTIAARSLELTSRWYAGEWLETDAAARALVHVGQIGQVEVDPNSRIRLIKTGADEYRIRLARGRIYAGIVAAPRLFLVETPSATAIDLGCAYTLDVDEDGGNLLRVTSGWVALARDGRESFVPAGAAARSEADGRIGTAYFTDATDKFKRALTQFDFAADKSGALAIVLAEARPRDALTLWQMLARTSGNEREQTYNRLTALVPAAKDINKVATLRLDAAALAQWKEAAEFAGLDVDPRQIPAAGGVLKPVGPLLHPRSGHTSTRLPDGKVLLAGGNDGKQALASAELFDPATGRFTATGSMTSPRFAHEATLLPNGKVLITGGKNGYSQYTSAELYDPATGRFAVTGNMQISREAHRATLLDNGKVLITGGLSAAWPQQRLAELYDPATGMFAAVGEMTTVRADHTATLLPNGQVLLCAGSTGRIINQDVTDTAELFDPQINRFTPAGSLAVPRHKFAAVRLRNGRVLVIGGADSRLRGFYNSAEIYDPATGRFTPTGSMSTARYKIREAAVLLPDGKVLVAGGGARLEVYDPTTGVFGLLSDRVTAALHYSTTTPLNNGAALIAGGYSGDGLANAGAWLYLPESKR
ncbi:MAG TPA: kelch repeat-containing protein [Blastocatellia bacterium]|nr:kelch repeat-containing protein [Blastocatellia bacterium]HMZ17078.1 kelch repeat-containing protein [Blastocatellia bacterium]HNG32375.1 kelch repeat-containing protein [Blastocatellia bacterium]